MPFIDFTCVRACCKLATVPAAALSPDTAPHVIEALHRYDVAAELTAVLPEWEAFGAHPNESQLIDCLSHATFLPPWNVSRALHHFGVIASPDLPRAQASGGALMIEVIEEAGL